MDYSALFKHHVECGADVSLCVLPVDTSEASELGILKMEKSGRISEFCEKPDRPELIESLKVDVDTWGKSGVTAERPLMASMGIYLFKTEALVEVLKGEPMMDFGRDIIPYSLSRYGVCGYIFNGYWEDIGTIRAFYRANLDLTAEDPKFNFYDPQAPIYSHPRFLPASHIQKCELQRSILSEGCEIKDSAISESVIGIRSIIRENTRISQTLMLGADYYEESDTACIPLGVGSGCVVQGAIIDKNARIGSNVRIVNSRGLRDFDGDNYFIRDGIVIAPKNAVIEDGTEI
jgi:glucose-1-phosphate adenylyltransferase